MSAVFHELYDDRIKRNGADIVYEANETDTTTLLKDEQNSSYERGMHVTHL